MIRPSIALATHKATTQGEPDVTDVRHDEGVYGVELAYSPSPDVPFTEVMTHTARVGAAELGWRTQGGRHRMDVLGAEGTATTQPWRDELRDQLTAQGPQRLGQPVLEIGMVQILARPRADPIESALPNS